MSRLPDVANVTQTLLKSAAADVALCSRVDVRMANKPAPTIREMAAHLGRASLSAWNTSSLDWATNRGTVFAGQSDLEVWRQDRFHSASHALPSRRTAPA
jgi:hypothetical protein